MERYIYNEKNGLWYELQGDYYLPCLNLSDESEVYIGIWGRRHRRYLKTHRKVLYTSLLTSGKLNSYLADIDRQADKMFYHLVRQLAKAEDVTEALKAADQMEWVRRMNSVRNRASDRSQGNFIHIITERRNPTHDAGFLLYLPEMYLQIYSVILPTTFA